MIVDNFGERSSAIKLNKSQANKLFKNILHMLKNPEESRYRKIHVRCNYWVEIITWPILRILSEVQRDADSEAS